MWDGDRTAPRGHIDTLPTLPLSEGLSEVLMTSDSIQLSVPLSQHLNVTGHILMMSVQVNETKVFSISDILM